MQSGFRRDFLSCIVGVGLLFAHAVLPYLSCQAVKLSLGEAHRLSASRLPSDLTSGEVGGRLAAPLNFCPTVGMSICLALCLRHSGTVIERQESAACGFVSWSNAAYHVPRTPCSSSAGSPGDNERQRRASLGNTSQDAARRLSVCYMHDEQVDSGFILTELECSAI